MAENGTTDVRDDFADDQTSYVPLHVLEMSGSIAAGDTGRSAKAHTDDNTRTGNNWNGQDLDAADYSGIEHSLDMLRERRVRSAHGDLRRAIRSGDLARASEAKGILKQAYRNPHLFGVLFDHVRIHNPDQAIFELVEFGKVTKPALQIATVRLLEVEYERANKERIARGGEPGAAFTTFLAQQWDTDPVTIRRLQSKARRIEPDVELPFAGTIFDTQRDMETLARKAPSEQKAYSEHARQNRTFFVLADRLVREARRRMRKALFEAELQALDEIGRNDSPTRGFLYTLPLANSAKWLADQIDAHRNSLEAA